MSGMFADLLQTSLRILMMLGSFLFLASGILMGFRCWKLLWSGSRFRIRVAGDVHRVFAVQRYWNATATTIAAFYLFGFVERDLTQRAASFSDAFQYLLTPLGISKWGTLALAGFLAVPGLWLLYLWIFGFFRLAVEMGYHFPPPASSPKR